MRVVVRVVAATNRDLRRAVVEGSLREDFYYRLGAYEIILPPLRDRRSDIPLLVEHFRGRTGRQLGLEEFPGPTAQTLAVLEAYPWPGNVRELENVIQRAAVDLGSLADAEGVRPLLQGAPQATVPDQRRPAIGDDLTLEELERAPIDAVLRRGAGNRTRVAKILGIERKSLYRKAQRLGIDLDPAD